MEHSKQTSFKWTDHLKFILPSLLGIFLFMIPITITENGETSRTIPIAFFADQLKALLENHLSTIMMVIITVTAILTVVVKVIGGHRLAQTPFFQKLFDVSPFWTIVRVVGAILAIMTLFELGPEFVYSDATGNLLLGDLLHTLFAVFFFAGLFLPLLLNFGLLDFFGSIMTIVMRPLFKLPGRSSIDALASWLGDGTIGVLLTSKQYEQGAYTKKEAAIIGTTFSIVSITFSLVIIQEVGLGHMFPAFYGTVLLAGFIAAIITPRIPPLSRKEDVYITGTNKDQTPQIPKGYNVVTWGYHQAVKQGQSQTSILNFFKQGAQNVLDMWMGVAPIVMAFGTIAVIIAEYTPIFTWLGMPFIPLLELMQIPEAAAASETMLVGFADMFLPAVIGSSIESEMTRFIIAALSVTQLIYMSEVGGLLLGSKIPVNIKELFIIFLERTLITLPVITLVAHLLF
ncbi:YjiH family protein [Pontibacillus litoralis]|uniref:Membrane protein n=1 Tax=Pontibacillus litoralis JSM 072002 TaxID=1385512 RepID=A0A0A5G7K4_9BACI|nr:YjiH family protein [Pontibacillus litoralis]KGX87163.1 membrane protein [Pontibacillus litoralis JSM 072002]